MLLKMGAIVKTEDGEGVVCGVETLKEVLNVQFENEEGRSYKKYNAADVKVIRNPRGTKNENDNLDSEDIENLKELEKLEKLEKEERKNVESSKDEY